MSRDRECWCFAAPYLMKKQYVTHMDDDSLAEGTRKTACNLLGNATLNTIQYNMAPQIIYNHYVADVQKESISHAETLKQNEHAIVRDIRDTLRRITYPCECHASTHRHTTGESMWHSHT